MQLFGWKALPYAKINTKFQNASAPLWVPKAGRSIATINKWVNRYVQYRPDMDDKWQKPIETLTLASGDCEDYVLLKRAILLSLKYKPGPLVIVQDAISRQAHAILPYLLPTGWHILDNLTDKIYHEQKIKHYMPIIAYSEDRTYTFGKPLPETKK